MDIATQLISSETTLALSSIKIFIELITSGQLELQTETFVVIYNKLVQEISLLSFERDRLNQVTKLLHLVIEREEDLLIRYKNEFIPSSLRAFLDSDFVHSCNLLFGTSFIGLAQEVEDKHNLNTLLGVITSDQLLSILCRDHTSDLTLKLLLHLAVSSKSSCLKQVLICLRALSHSVITGSDLILQLICALYSGDVTSAQKGLCYGILTVFYSATDGHIPSYHLQDTYWEITQQGLLSQDSLTRKQSIFLLKRGAGLLSKQDTTELPLCVAFLRHLDTATELCENWLTVIYLLETYEETQTHILRSSLPLLHSLATYVRRQELAGASSVHHSWLLTLYTRLFSHESRVVSSWGLQVVLNSPMSHCSQTEVASFVTQSLVMALNDASLFSSNSALIDSVTEFVMRYFSNLCAQEAGHAMATLIRSVSLLSDIPLFYLLYALSRIDCMPVITRDGLLALQELFSRSVLAHSKLLITAIKCFTLRFITLCMNTSSCSWLDLFMLLTHMDINLSDSSQYTEFYSLVASLFCGRTLRDLPLPHFILEHFISAYIGTESITELCKSIDGEELIATLTDVRFPAKTARVVAQLAAVAGNSCKQSPKNILEHTLSPITQLLSCVPTHPYMPTEQVARVFELSKEIFSTMRGSVPGLDIGVITRTVYNPVVVSLTELALYLISHSDYDELEQLIGAIRSYELSNGIPHTQHWDNLARELASRSHQQLQSSVTPDSIHLTDSVCSLVCALTSVLAYGIQERVWTVISPTVQLLISAFPLLSDNTHILTPTTRLRVKYINATLTAVSVSRSMTRPLSVSDDSLLVGLRDLATITDHHGLLSILGLLSLLLPHNFNTHTLLCSECVLESWRAVRDSDELHSLFPAFLCCCLNEQLMLHTRYRTEDITATFVALIEEVIEWGVKRMGVLHMLVVHLVDIWSSAGDIDSIAIYWRQIVRIFSSTPEPNKAMKQLDGALSFGLLVEEYDFSSWRQNYRQNMSHLYLIELLGLLTHVNITRLEGYSSLVERFVQELLRIETQRCRVKNKFCSFNSRLHKDKIITWQLILVLLASVNADRQTLPNTNNEQLVLSLLREHLHTNTQPSVRCYIEWSCVVLLSGCDVLERTLLSQMRLYSQSPAAQLPFVYISYVLILSLVLKKLQPPSALLSEIIALLVGMMSSSNTQLRHVSLDLLRQISQSADSEDFSLASSYIRYCPAVGQFAEQSNWTIATHPVTDLTVLFLLQELPSRFGLQLGYRIGLVEFSDSSWDINHTIALGNATELEAVCDTDKLVLKGELKTRGSSQVKDLMQKKIMPWEIMDGEFSFGLDGRSCESNVSNQRGDLILIASLIDKPTNLGGMCRTCEVFGASTLVISDRKFVENTSFTSLSVSAERWMCIEEVKPGDLPEYLSLLKERGYTVVGIEQTPNSSSLQEFSFPRCSALLVGHEKYGIPVELLERVDCCVQIPQYGVIRSLNVHVSSAISIWHYTTQHSVRS